MPAELVYGFVPRSVVDDLHDIGNWKSRATAIDTLHKHLKDVTSKSVLLPHLPEFTRFLAGLVADPNFKIAISSMAIVGDLANKVGKDLEAHLRNVVPALVEKFTDSKVLVRSANMKVLRKLMTACSTRGVLDLLSSAAMHTSWRVREEVLNCHIVVMLQFTRDSYEPQRMFKMLLGCMSDSKDKVRLVALEGMAVLANRLGTDFQGLLRSGGVPEAVRSQVATRLANGRLPGVNADGMVQHVVEMPAGADAVGSVELASASFAVGNAGGKLPWESPGPRPRMRTASTTEPAGAPLMPLHSNNLDRVADAHAAVRPLGHAPDQNTLWSPSHVAPNARPVGVTGQGRLQPGDAPLIAHAPGVPRGGVIAGAAGVGARAPDIKRTVSPYRDPALDAAAGGGGNGGLLQPLKHMWGASRPGPDANHNGSSFGQLRSPIDSFDVDSPLSPSKGYQSVLNSRHSVHSAGENSRECSELPASRSVPMRSHAGEAGRGPPPASSSGAALWLHPTLEPEHAGQRSETFSPSKAEMLARLKNRQIEKRVATAQMAVETSGDSTTVEVSGPARRFLHPQLSDNSSPTSSSYVPPQRSTSGPVPGRGMSNGNGSLPLPPPQHHAYDDEPAASSASAGGRRGGLGSLAARLGRGPPETPARAVPGMSAGSILANAPDDSFTPGRGTPARMMRVRSADVVSSPGAGGGRPPPNGYAPTTPTPGGPGMRSGNSTSWNENSRSGPSMGAAGVAEVPFDDLTPVLEPERHLRGVIAKLIESNNADRKELDWQGQYEALTDARRLVKHHPDAVRGCLHEFVRAATPSVDQLRSSTSKNALTMFQEMFVAFGRGMDRELDEVVPTLLKKAGEVSNAGRENFLAAEADRALIGASRACSEARFVSALLACAAHKSPPVRTKVAFHLDCHLEACAGTPASRAAIAGNWACLERLFKAAAAFLDEGALETRTYGKRVIWHIRGLVSGRAEFDRLTQGVQPASLQRKVTETVDGMNGPPPPPSRAVNSRQVGSRQVGAPPSPGRSMFDGAAGGMLSSAPTPARQSSYSAPPPGQGTPERRRGGAAANGQANGGGGGALVGIPEHNTPARMKRSSSTGRGGGEGASGYGPAAQEALVKALQQVNAKDFRERQEALRMVEALLPQLPGVPDSLLVSLLDGMVARLSDPNAKVATQALELVGEMAAVLRDRLSLAVNTLVPALIGALGASNEKIRAIAMTTTDRLIANIEPAYLVQNFSHCVNNGNLQRGKQIVVEKLVGICAHLYASKPALVVRYAVPAAFALMNDGRGEGKAAANTLLAALARLMGGALLDQAAALSPALQQRVADAVAAAGGGRGR